MENKKIDEALNKIIMHVYYAVRDASRVFKIPPGAIGINIVNIYQRSVMAECGSVVSTYRNNVVLVAEEWLHSQTNYVDVYFLIAKEVRYIYQNWNVNRYKKNDELFADLDLIETWAKERESSSTIDDAFRVDLSLDSTVDALAFANFLTTNNLESHPTLSKEESDVISTIERDFEVKYKE